MQLSARAFAGGVAALAATATFAAPAAPAQTYSFSLNLSGPSALAVGQPTTIQASGVIPPPADYWFPTYFAAIAIPANVVSPCPAKYLDAIGVAARTGGEVLVMTSREVADAGGNFSNVAGFTPPAAGPWLICGYTMNGISDTLATATLSIDVRAAAPTPAPPVGAAPPAAVDAKPTNAKTPRVTRSGDKLVCNPGRWSNKTGRYSYRWFVNGKQKKGARGKKLRVTRKLRGRKLSCDVTATNGAGTTTVVSRPLQVG